MQGSGKVTIPALGLGVWSQGLTSRQGSAQDSDPHLYVLEGEHTGRICKPVAPELFMRHVPPSEDHHCYSVEAQQLRTGLGISQGCAPHILGSSTVRPALQ